MKPVDEAGRPEPVEGRAAQGVDVSSDLRRVALSPTSRRSLLALAAVGVLTTAAGLLLVPDRLWANWLLVSYYFVGLSLAGLCFVALHYTTAASWSVAVRRVPEALAGLLPLALVALAIVLVARPQLYAWTSGDVGPGDRGALAFKRFWLNRSFFLARTLAYALIWTLFARAVRARSQRQDADGDPRWTRANVRLSAVFLVVFALTFTLASFDWVMSLEPAWHSTIFAVYNFAGLFVGGLAAIIVIAVWLERAGPLDGVLNDEHLHDLGKLLFAFSTFWMYIWFSQYMLIWYVNLPEESVYFIARVRGAWFSLFLLNVIFNWVVPFLVLIRRDAKRWRDVLVGVALVVLIGRWLDLYLMIAPPLVKLWRPAPAGSYLPPSIGLWEIGLFAGAVGAFGLALERVLRAAPAVPIGDPQLDESLQYEH